MRSYLKSVLLALLLLAGCETSEPFAPAGSDAIGTQRQGGDSFSWLEERTGAAALSWVRKRNEQTIQKLSADPRFERYYRLALGAISAKAELPGSNIVRSHLHNGWVYDILRDEKNPRGLWRRTRVESFKRSLPDWEVVLDIDARNTPSTDDLTIDGTLFFDHRCLLFLSKGHGPNSTGREFDLKSKSFVDEGFEIPPSANVPAGLVAWKDTDTLLLSSPGSSVASQISSFDTVREWRRGTPLAEARTVFYQHGLQAVIPRNLQDVSGRRTLILIGIDSHGGTTLWRSNGAGWDKLTAPSAFHPEDLGLYRGELIFLLRRDWQLGDRIWRAGSLISVPLSAMNSSSPPVHPVVEPRSGEIVASSAVSTPNAKGVLVVRYRNFKTFLDRFTLINSKWVKHTIEFPTDGFLLPAMNRDPVSREVFVTDQSYLRPLTVYEIDMAQDRVRPVVSLPAAFDTSELVVRQLEATSHDGTRVPYYVVGQRSQAGDRASPTLVHAYGAFGDTSFPLYSGVLGRLWLDAGGTYVVANVRGGGELGPAWHVTKTARARTYEDIVAVANDLQQKGISSPTHMGIEGMSAGGLLVGVMFTSRQELFNAFVIEAGVLDQFRRDLTARGDADVSEFGSLDLRDERHFLAQTSPFQNLTPKPNPVPLLLLTTTTDEMVHPAQHRRFAAKMDALGMPYFYLEVSEGGHAVGGLTPAEIARTNAIKFIYLTQRLADRKP